jgi:molybdate transport system regulatory protein
MAKKPLGAHTLLPRWRVLRSRDVLLGPGKADLLEAIARTGSLRLAARSLGMSYMRAWKLVQTMNGGAYTEPLVSTARGGSAHGSAALTRTGRAVIALYREMEKKSLSAASPFWRRLRKFLA